MIKNKQSVRPFYVAAIASFSAAYHLAAIASDPLPPKIEGKKPVQQIEQIDVKASKGGYDARREETAGKIVVTADEISKFGDTQLADVMRRLPSVSVIGGEIRMRGIGSGYTQILLNGERPPAGFSLESLSPDLVESIEIIRAATAEYSTQSIAGTINVILKKKISVADRELKIGLSTGKGYQSPNISYTSSDKDGNFSYSLPMNLNYIDGDTTPRSIQFGQDQNGVENLFQQWSTHTLRHFIGGGISPRLNWTLKNGDMVTWQTFVNSSHNNSSGDTEYSLIIGSSPFYPKLLTNTITNVTTLRTDLSWTQTLPESAKLELKIGLNGYDRNVDFRQQGFDTNNSPNLDSTVSSLTNEAGATFTGKYSTILGKGHNLVTGWDTGFTRRHETRDQQDKPLPGILPVISSAEFNIRVFRVALFAQDEWNFTKDWSANAGLRWEGFFTKSSGNTFTEIDSRSSILSPIFQTLYKFPARKGEQIRLALTRTFKAPALSSLIPRPYTTANNSPTDPDTQGNPDLRPEVATGLDLAYEKFWEQGAVLSLAASFRHINDVTRNGLQLINGRWISLPINDGTADTKSLDAEAKFPIQTIYKQAPPIDLRFNASRNWSRVNVLPGPNARLAQQIPYVVNFGLDYRLRGGEFVVGGNIGFRGGGPVRTGLNQASFFSSRRELDLYGLWKISTKNQLRFTLGNLLRMDYLYSASYFDSSGSLQRSDRLSSSMYGRLNWEIKL